MNILMLHQHLAIEGDHEQTRFFGISRRLVSGGDSVTVITGNSSLDQPLGNRRIGLVQKEGVAVIVFNIRYSHKMNWPEKCRALFTYYRWSLRQGQRLPRPDLIVASTPPLTAAYAAVLLSSRFRVPLILEVKELWPDVLIERGTLKNRALVSLVRRMEQKAYSGAARIIAASNDMAEAMEKKADLGGPVHIWDRNLPGEGSADQFKRIAAEVL